MDIYDLFSKFELEQLPKEWVQNLWKDDFSEAVEFPTEYDEFLENTEIGELMSSASKFIKEWLEVPGINNTFAGDNRKSSHNRSSLNASQADHRSWQNLIANNVHHRALVAVLSVFISRGKSEKQFHVKRLGLIATDLYLVLLAIPGSQVFHIFNPILYSHAVESLKICSILSSSSNNSKPAAKKKKGKRHDDDDDYEDEDEANNDSEDDNILPSDKQMVIKLLNVVLSDLHFALKGFQMKGQDDSLLLTIQILILVTRLERSSISLFSKSPSHNTVSYLAYKAYKTLMALCSEDHGEVEQVVSFIMREMMPGFLIFDQKGLKLTPKEALVIKDHSVQFIVNLLRCLKDSAYLGVYTLIQHISVRIPDKADLRAKGVQVVQELLDILPHSLYAHTVVWLMNLCHNDQVKNRITGIEIVTKLLHGNEKVPTSPVRPVLQKKKSKQKDVNGNPHDENEHVHTNGLEGEDGSEDEDRSIILSQYPDFSKSNFLLATIFSRCKDVASSVRAKSLAILAQLISSNNRNIKSAMESIFVTPYVQAQSIESSNVFEKEFLDFQTFLRNIKNEANPNVDPLPGAKAVIKLLELFVEDEKVFVRKSALQVLANIFLMNDKWMTNKLLQVMVDNCRDMSVSVRKLIVQCLTDLLNRYPTHPELPKFWVQGVLPLLADQEVKSQEKVLEALQTVVLDNLVAYDKMKTAHHALPWTLLALIAESNKRQLFLYACHKWTLTNSLRQTLITVLKTHIGTENNDAAWFMLASFSEYLDIRDPEFVLDYFYENVLESQQVDEYCCQLVTEVMHLSWRQLPVLAQVNLCDCLLRHLSQFTVPLPMIARCVDICQLITETHAESPDQARERVKEWASNLINICECKLEKMIGPDAPLEVADEDRLCQYIFSVGELVLICPAQLKHSVLLLIQNLLESEDIEEENDDDGNKDLGEEFEKRWKGHVSASVQSVAVVTLGKLCLQKEHTAKVLVPLFASLLSETPHNEIKINAMIVLTDMCVKFTSVVENHLPEMCICLRDKDLQVRENTLTLMIQLIQEDYLKVRCPMLFHLLSMLNDEDQHIRDMISSFIVNSMLVKQKNILVQHFVEGLFHYNAYLGHPTYSKGRMMSMRERTVFSLEGADRQAQRRNIYRFMLENMLDDFRFSVTYRLCTDVLAGVADGAIDLSPSGTTLLQDALHVLSSDEIRLAQLRGASKDCDDDEPDPEAQVAEAISNLARKTLVSQVVKKNMIENVVPIFIKLKHHLKKHKSPLVRDLMACLRELMKDYKAEINDILAADKESAAEILHDLQASRVEEEDSGDESAAKLCNEEVLKKAVMDVVALTEVRKSLNTTRSPQVSLTRLDSTHASEKSNRTSVDRTPSVKRTSVDSQLEGVSPEGKRTSGSSTPAVKSRTSSTSSKTSPGNSDVSKSSPQSIGLNSKSSSPSSSLDVNTQNEAVEKPVMKPRKNRVSTASTCSEGSTTSRSSRSSRRNKKR